MYSRGDGSPLVCYGTDNNGFKLPDWIKFNPVSRTFYGVPDELGTEELLVSCMHPQTGAFKKIKFNVKVVPNDHPMTHVFHSVPDIEVVEDQFFKVVLSLLAFSDKETELYDGIFNCTGVAN